MFASFRFYDSISGRLMDVLPTHYDVNNHHRVFVAKHCQDQSFFKKKNKQLQQDDGMISVVFCFKRNC